ncbi:class I SAM-dependent methyltransferase [Neisseriaceae bacterium B1]
MLFDILPFAHNALREYIRAGDTVIDATAGNGHDTLLLAQCVGETGRVLAFDIQAAALEATKARLAQHDLLARVQLIQAGHERMAEFVPHDVAAVVFNFGYLPRGDKAITTLPETSLQAVQSALDLLKIKGLLVAVLYDGHETGKQEKVRILDFLAQLPSHKFRVLQYGFLNRHNAPPMVVLVEKAA